MEQHQTFWKPEKRVKEHKQLKPGQKKIKKELPEHKQGILSHHTSNPSKADRAEFPLPIVKAAIERSGGICQQCRQAPCTSTHHAMSRNRSGRGVLSNAFRSCGKCHVEIEGNEEMKQAIIALYTQLYGKHFYFDEQDIEEFTAKQAAIEEAEQNKLHELERIEPVVNLLTAATGRKLRAKEVRMISGLEDIGTFAKLMADILGAESKKPDEKYGYGNFYD